MSLCPSMTMAFLWILTAFAQIAASAPASIVCENVVTANVSSRQMADNFFIIFEVRNATSLTLFCADKQFAGRRKKCGQNLSINAIMEMR